MCKQVQEIREYKVVIDIICNRCGAYLFTERECWDGRVERLNSTGEVYDEIADEFYCEKCAKEIGLI